ncbi:MAG: LamG-like jellyroll fold domain-containing protein [Planctomycetota bacterium]
MTLKCHVSLALLVAPLAAAAQGPVGDATFFHDFEDVTGNTITALVGPVATKSANIPVGSTGTFCSSSSQHIQSPAAGFGNVATQVRLLTSTPSLSFSILYNARSDTSNRLKRLLTSFDGTGALPPSQLIFDRVRGGQLRLTTGGLAVLSDASIPEDAGWHHAGFTFSNGTVQFFVDGAPFGATKLLGVSTIAAQTHDWHLVEDVFAVSSMEEYWRGGSYDNAGLWTRTLSGPEMALLSAAPCAACAFRNGSGINPTDYSCVNGPVVGHDWMTTIAVTSQTAATFVVLGAAPATLPFGTGEFLLAPTASLAVLGATPVAGTHTVRIPSRVGLVGGRLSSQGVRLDGTTLDQLVLLNAQDVTLGF